VSHGETQGGLAFDLSKPDVVRESMQVVAKYGGKLKLLKTSVSLPQSGDSNFSCTSEAHLPSRDQFRGNPYQQADVQGVCSFPPVLVIANCLPCST
jgi:hypothetical protein